MFEFLCRFLKKGSIDYMQLGIIGLPKVGETTIFELLTEHESSSSNTMKANVQCQNSRSQNRLSQQISKT